MQSTSIHPTSSMATSWRYDSSRLLSDKTIKHLRRRLLMMWPRLIWFRFPVEDHNCPTIGTIMDFCEQAKPFMDESNENVMGIHCKVLFSLSLWLSLWKCDDLIREAKDDQEPWSAAGCCTTATSSPQNKWWLTLAKSKIDFKCCFFSFNHRNALTKWWDCAS